ncbi:S-adenosylmethionine decarboxylase proenzyme-like [Oopsacas minuta]|uniref:S-adenosylmethionine decarboxylase proenzyme n=1 Tax=Oopsacas minuta TaxID=111878 RepID=A0AAV7JXU3_9METZ|nr:S-adenosylmethionine decarboxylase proenzyme-like [Oopsacas minuta]
MVDPIASYSQFKKRSDSPKIYQDARDILNHVGFFEGTEKLLEVWLESEPDDPLVENIEENIHVDNEAVTSKSADRSIWPSLRLISEEEWNHILKHYAKCTVLSVISNDKIDAYILSESSLIVFDNKFILKTCGTTTPLAALQPILTFARERCKLSVVKDVFYSRRGYTDPFAQVSPHRSFDEEVKYLSGLFGSASAYILGRLNGDPWYLYTVDNYVKNQQADQTLEILMTSLPSEIMSHFILAVHGTAEEMCEAVGIKSLFPTFIFDLKAFDPCGFSLNGIKGQFYVNCHVTPQTECSYLSLETNWPEKDYTEIVKKLVTTFNPGNVLLTLFVNQSSICPNSILGVKEDDILGYKRVDKQYCEFSNSYNVTLLTITKPSFKL